MTEMALNQSTVERPPAPPRSWTASRIWGHAFVALWALIGIGFVWYLATSWNPELVAKYGPRYWSGLKVTVSLVLSSLLAGAVLSVPIALGRLSKNRYVGALAYAYVYTFRGTPLLAQVFLIYYGLGQFSNELKAIGLWGFFRDAWNCGFLAFTLNTAAYQAEILAGAIRSVPRGQWEGAAALGLRPSFTFRRIIFPQALIVALRPYGNEIILMIKGSAIVAIITVYDLMGQARWVFSKTFDFQAYLWAAVFYLIVVEILRNIWAWLEARLTRHLNR
ncbi:MAG: ABC transporter permease [Rhizobiaceae bacterium]|jgi:polar amino acid transport system permease protein